MLLAMETSVPVSRFGEEKGLEMIAKAGFDGVDYSFYDAHSIPQLLSDDYLKKAEESRRMLDHFGLACNQAHAAFPFRVGMPFSLHFTEYRLVWRSIEYAAALGVRQIIVHSVRDMVNPKNDTMDFNIIYHKTFEPLCRDLGIRIGVENLTVTKTPERLDMLCDALDPDLFVACLDTGHANTSGCAPADFARAIRPGRLQSLHVHDNGGLKDDHTIPYLGTIDWSAFMAALAEINYQGDLTMEAITFLRKFPNDMLQDALNMNHAVGRQLISLFEASKK